jgi:hypothetical protein
VSLTLYKTHNEEQVDIVQPQALQTLLQAQCHTGGIRRPHFAGDKHFLPLDAGVKGLLQALADLVLIAVAIGAVDELVPVLKRI